MREIKFRAWDKEIKKMFFGRPGDDRWNSKTGFLDVSMGGLIDCELMQYTGLKDKNGLAEVYEGDIVDEYGNIKGNIYQMDKGETDTVIQGFGTKTWCETYRRAILLGLKDAE